jgi:hypothetical protein
LRARLTDPALKQQLLLSRDREGAVLSCVPLDEKHHSLAVVAQ